MREVKCSGMITRNSCGEKQAMHLRSAVHMRIIMLAYVCQCMHIHRHAYTSYIYVCVCLHTFYTHMCVSVDDRDTDTFCLSAHAYMYVIARTYILRLRTHVPTYVCMHACGYVQIDAKRDRYI